jgi:hypothetical protein
LRDIDAYGRLNTTIEDENVVAIQNMYKELIDIGFSKGRFKR